MNIKIASQYIALIVLILVIIFIWLLIDGKSENQYVLKEEYIVTGYDDYKELVENLLSNYSSEFDCSAYQDKGIKAGIISHHIEVVSHLIADFYNKLKCDSADRDTFVIIGPDHFERGQTSISTASLSYSTPFGILKTNQKIVNDLTEAGINIDNQILAEEHAINSQAVFIKYLFPEAQIVAITFKAYTNEESLDDILEVLTDYKDKITLIASVDFSHYHPYAEAEIIDAESYQKIKSLKFDDLTLDRVDSPISIKLLQRFIDSQKLKDLVYIKQDNSYNITGREDNTTGYISALFSRLDQFRLFFVGDIMLSRAVGDKMQRENNWDWPFKKVNDFLSQADILFGNLECPISDKGQNIGSIYSFRADPKVTQGLKNAGFDIVSVANNHINNWDKPAMKDTFDILSLNGIDYVGGGQNYSEAHQPKIIKLSEDFKVAYLAYTTLGSNASIATNDHMGIAKLDENLASDISLAKDSADLVVVSIHFGDEYINYSSPKQIEIAHQIIDAGADLLIGHHPHVIGQVEKYKNGYIFYSLGNFVFDQNFSEATRIGLIVEAVIDNNELNYIKEHKIRINNYYQPELLVE